MTKGLLMDVLHRRGQITDCTRGGITSRHNQLVLVGSCDLRKDAHNRCVVPLPDGAQVFSAGPDRPAVALVVRHIGGPVLHIEPVSWDGETSSWRLTEHAFMSGGNSADITDSRFSELTRQLTGQSFYGAVHVHDRREF